MSKHYQGWTFNTNEEYHSGDGISSSSLKPALLSAAHYKSYKARTHEPSDAMILGTRIHMAVLEPREFERAYITVGQCTATKKSGDPCTNAGIMLSGGHAFCGVHAKGRSPDQGEVITQEAYDQCIGCRDAIRNHPEAMALLTGGVSEASGYLEYNGMLVKTRPDYRIKGEVITDIKSCESARPEDFAKSIANFKYHLSAMFYLMICNRLDQCAYTWRFIAVEKNPPHGVMVYAMSADMMRQGEELYIRALNVIKNAQELDDYPCYPQTVETIDLPRWAK